VRGKWVNIGFVAFGVAVAGSALLFQGSAGPRARAQAPGSCQLTYQVSNINGAVTATVTTACPERPVARQVTIEIYHLPDGSGLPAVYTLAKRTVSDQPATSSGTVTTAEVSCAPGLWKASITLSGTDSADRVFQRAETVGPLQASVSQCQVGGFLAAH
jgi:hypothetical protein